MARQRKDKRRHPRAQLSTPFLHAKKLQELATDKADKAPQKVHSAATKAQIKKVEDKWVEYVFSNKLLDCYYLLTLVRYCDTISEDPWIVLKWCTPQYFKYFFEWTLDSSAISHYSTVEVLWKYLRLVYKKQYGHTVHEAVGLKINNVSGLHEVVNMLD